VPAPASIFAIPPDGTMPQRLAPGVRTSAQIQELPPGRRWPVSSGGWRQLEPARHHALDRNVFVEGFPAQRRAADLQSHLGQLHFARLLEPTETIRRKSNDSLVCQLQVDDQALSPRSRCHGFGFLVDGAHRISPARGQRVRKPTVPYPSRCGLERHGFWPKQPVLARTCTHRLRIARECEVARCPHPSKSENVNHRLVALWASVQGIAGERRRQVRRRARGQVT